MNSRFTQFFIVSVFLSIFFFFKEIEPNSLVTLSERGLAIFLFQFDYVLLFCYIVYVLIRKFEVNILMLSGIYLSLFLLGMASLIIIDEKTYDVFYSYIQPLIRAIYVWIFFKMGLDLHLKKDKFSVLFYSIAIIYSLLSLYLLNKFPRESMLSFNFYWAMIAVFWLVGLQLERHNKPNYMLFIVGLSLTAISDLYYILPPEARLYEFTFILIRVCNTTGEFLLVNYIIRFFTPSRILK
ncbi:MAG: hypothetical protein ACK4NY_19415 [Spirosomataceae bacterium]